MTKGPADGATLAARYLQMLNDHDPDAVEDFVAPGYVNHNPFVEDGPEGNRAFWTGFFTAFPDIRATMDDLVVAGDRVVGRFTYRGTHTGPFSGMPATGRTVEMRSIDIWRTGDGYFVEHWDELNLLDLFQQIGMIPSPGDAGDAAASAPAGIPDDDPGRRLTVARPDTDEGLPHLGLVGATYTVLVGGADTAGRYTLVDMHVPPAGGPPPHRHDFEEMFTVLEGEVEVTFRGETLTAHAGETINVPANAPHAFRNATAAASRLLCLCAPAGQDEFFALVGQPVPTRTTPPPTLDAAGEAAFIARARSLAPRYHVELPAPPAATS